MQLFNLIKSSIKNLMNLPNLHCSNHPRQFEEKNPQISINKSIDQITFAIQAQFSNSP